MGVIDGYFQMRLAALSLLLTFAQLSFAQSAVSETVLKTENVQQQIVKEKAAGPSFIVIETNVGNVTLELFDEQSPITVQNFLNYVDSGQYNETIFHRVIPRFMIQGGGFTTDMQEKPTGDPIKNESKNRAYNERGTIAMARLADPDSATSQFYINVKMNRSLDYRLGKLGYTVFGKVIEGMHVVDDISVRQTHSLNGHQNVPVEQVVIQQIRRAEESEVAATAAK